MKTDAIFEEVFKEIPNILFKFPNMSREEIEAMLNISLLRGTKVYHLSRQIEQTEKFKKGLLQKLFV